MCRSLPDCFLISSLVLSLSLSLSLSHSLSLPAVWWWQHVHEWKQPWVPPAKPGEFKLPLMEYLLSSCYFPPLLVTVAWVVAEQFSSHQRSSSRGRQIAVTETTTELCDISWKQGGLKSFKKSAPISSTSFLFIYFFFYTDRCDMKLSSAVHCLEEMFP